MCLLNITKDRWIKFDLSKISRCDVHNQQKKGRIQGPLHYQPKQGLIFCGDPSTLPYICIVLSQKIGNLIAPWYSKNPEFFGTEMCSSIFVGVTFFWWIKQERTEAPTSFDNPPRPQNNLQVLYAFCFYYVPIDIQSYLVRLGVWIPQTFPEARLLYTNTYSPGTRRISDVQGIVLFLRWDSHNWL